jgi:hypothetical protein
VNEAGASDAAGPIRMVGAKTLSYHALRFFEISRVLVPLDHVASFIVKRESEHRETQKELGALSQFDLPAVKAVVIFTLPRPRPGNEAIGNLEEVNGRLSSWRGWPPNTRFGFVISFHAKSRKIWLKQTDSLHFSLNRKRLCVAPVVKTGRCHRD